jgi:hypothetical protein
MPANNKQYYKQCRKCGAMIHPFRFAHHFNVCVLAPSTAEVEVIPTAATVIRRIRIPKKGTADMVQEQAAVNNKTPQVTSCKVKNRMALKLNNRF